MVSFYPGPSRVYSKVPLYLKDAYTQGIMSINHRSEEFVAISKKTVTLLKEKLNIPKSYSIYFVSSATECWEIIAQSLIEKEAIHIFNGAFGEKWFQYTKKLKPHVKSLTFNRDEGLLPEKITINTPEVICLTQNETSNGTQVKNEIIQSIRKNNPNSLLAIDATSSMGGIALNFEAADIWFASVQKCFGLPAGLGLLICSPKTLEHARSVNDQQHYNSLLFLDDMMKNWQTSYTPSVVEIYLLMRVMESVKPIDSIHKTIINRHQKWEAFFDTKSEQLNLLIKNKSVRSQTVLTVEAKPEVVEKVKVKAKKAGIILGEGYGELKSSTFRIANFPAIQRKEIALLMDFLHDFT